MRKQLVAMAMMTGVLIAMVPGAPASASHFISASLSPGTGVWGTTFTINISSAALTPVKLQRRFVGSSTWTDVSGQSKDTDTSGNATFGDKPVSNADYRGVVTTDGATSNAVRANVRVGVHISVTRSGQRALFQGRVLPSHPNTWVVLQMFDGINKRWNDVKWQKMGSRSTYAIAYQATRDGRRLFRVAWPTQDNSHVWNLSAHVSVTWTST